MRHIGKTAVTIEPEYFGIQHPSITTHAMRALKPPDTPVWNG
jgi:hypothetical protein